VPIFTPILLVPFGQRWLFEAEFEMEGEFERENGVESRAFEKGLEYLQLDFLAHRYVTVVAGRFLTPFGIFNERLHPIWSKNLQPTPLIAPIQAGSSNGLMLRGGARISPGLNLNYSGYYSALTQTSVVESKRMAGTRWGVFLPQKRLEIGASFQRLLQDERFNSVGLDATWQAPRMPLDIRMEYARNGEGSGYWVEGAYRLRRVGFWRPLLRRSQVVLRVDQFFAPSDSAEIPLNDPALSMGEAVNEEEGGHGALPEVDTVQLLAGWNYYFSDGLKLSVSYGRNFSSDENVLSLGLTYRFLF